MKKTLFFIFLILIITGIYFILFNSHEKKDPEKNTKNIIVLSPKDNSQLGQELKISGSARVFENMFSLRISGVQSGKIYLEKSLYANSKDIGQFGEFNEVLNINDITDIDGNLEQNILLEIFDNSAKDGEEIEKNTINLIFDKNKFLKIKTYFNNDKLDPNISCVKVFPTYRLIEKTKTTAENSIKELLKGVETKEKNKGFFSSIPSGTFLNKITIENQTAKIDFNENLDKNIGGSCRVSAIRAQIEETLKQFESVKAVVISINGRTEDILQP